MLDRIQVIPYELELRDTLDAALFQFDQFEKAAAEALSAQDVSRDAVRMTAEMLDEQAQAQRRVFDHLDAFLGAFARVSLLVFPISRTQMALRRGATMQACLGIEESSILADRELRGSWMHHDERVDWAVENGTGRSGQTFSRSTENAGDKINTFLRVIELDTLAVHYRDRNGTPKRAEMRVLAAALEGLDLKRKSAFDHLAVPEDV